MPKYFIQFAQSHEEFRLPELESLAKIENVKIVYDKEEYKKDCPFLTLEIETEEEAVRLVRRAILIRKIYELWAVEKTYEEIHSHVKAKPERWPQYDYMSFKFSVSAFGSTCSLDYQVRIINSFSYLGFKGDIDLKNPQVQFAVLEDYGMDLSSGNRDLVNKFNLKKRNYIGNTSMDAELSLIMANQALASSGKLIYDPFVGTGSFLFTCSHFGAYTIGSDIDGRQIRGQGNESIKSNIKQYQLQDRVLDNLVFDIVHHPWREGTLFDAIITDPPYGVRAGAKTLGRKDPTKKPIKTHLIDGIPAHKHQDYYPPTKPYEMSQLLIDLLEFSAKYLVVGGRLVYWLPNVVDEYSSTDIPTHPCIELISNSEQRFGQWSRRLITMEKVKEYIIDHQTHVNVKEHSEDSLLFLQKDKDDVTDCKQTEEKKPSHYLFREKVRK
ncbi:9832_t:CDS:10 [Entrophospora sp. SA101]|nr:5019_t:CDS:10 [Entrophospora sp. SA101]CAJ0755865.1 9832_t:CDS:10 [Entrophospora sp. SA101]